MNGRNLQCLSYFRQKYPSKNSEYIENNAMCSIKDSNDDDDLLLYCEGDEAEKNKDRLLSFDAKKYELVTTDEKLDDGEEFEFNGSETYESSPSDKFSPTGMIEYKISSFLIKLVSIIDFRICIFCSFV